MYYPPDIIDNTSPETRLAYVLQNILGEVEPMRR